MDTCQNLTIAGMMDALLQNKLPGASTSSKAAGALAVLLLINEFGLFNNCWRGLYIRIISVDFD